MTDSKNMENRLLDRSSDRLSDYGIYNADACDPLLRNRVIRAIQKHQNGETQTAQEEMTELVTYICQLEDALLRYHWGAFEHHQIHEILKCSTGLDIEARASALASMAAADA